MAQGQLGSVNINFTDSRKADPAFHSGANAATNPITNYAETEDVASLKSALSTFDPLTYTAEVLNIMSVNDLVFAWRACRGQQTSIASHYPAQQARS